MNAHKGWKTRRANKLLQVRLRWILAVTVIVFSSLLVSASFQAHAEVEIPQVNLKAWKEAKMTSERIVTMYTSRPEETDATPCIGANGQDVCVLWRNGQNLCATNSEKLGSVLKVEGLGECLVVDRMNSRYKTEVDWYNGYDDDCLDGYDTYDVCPQLKEAISFGAKKLNVIVK